MTPLKLALVKQRVALGQVWEQHRLRGAELWVVVTEPELVVEWDGPDENGTSWARNCTRATFLGLDSCETFQLNVDGVWASDSWQLVLAAPAQMGNSSKPNDLELPTGSL